MGIMQIKTVSRIAELEPTQWDGLVRQRYPFLRHGFLNAMEQQHCVGAHAGWLPQHLAGFERGRLVAAMPLYEKHNSWGEFVFDHAWADAYARIGMPYYPKIVSAIPFTPAAGQRLLCASKNRRTAAAALREYARETLRPNRQSSLHALFLADDEFAALKDADAIARSDCQFHWHNRDYRSFDDFLRTLKAKKRKNICQERARVARSGVRIRRLDGHTATDADWHAFTQLYRAIYTRKYGSPAFNREFFTTVAALLPTQIYLILAERSHKPVAAALLYCDDQTLYGRHWGCSEYLDCLHFELCYYQGIEICIERKLSRFNPGAQGEHKVARGFTPTRTQSLHWLAHNPFFDAIAQFARRERASVSEYIAAATRHSPYHPDCAPHIPQ